jgi:enoyl-CoA hydratase/carnithine racemase
MSREDSARERAGRSTFAEGEVAVRDEGRVRWITIDRPESKNGLTIEVNDAIIQAVRGAAETRELRVVAIGGANGAFSSGLDLKAAAAQAGGGPEELERRMRTYFHGLIRAVRACPKPVIAMVDGAAVGFGCDLALACDLRFCSDRARFGEVFVRRGLMPDGGGTWTLPRLVGLGWALELMFSGEVIGAEEALRLGIANRVVPAADFAAASAAYADKLAAGAPLVHRAVKEAVYAAQDGDLDAALENEVRGQIRLLGSRDFMEGMTAFFQKRDPDFKGE